MGGADNPFGLLEAVTAVGVLVTDDGGRIVLFNSKAQELFGYSREEALGKTIELLIPDEQRGVHERQRAAYGANPQPRPMGMGRDLAGRRRDGSVFDLEVGLTPLRVDGRIYVAAFMIDVTRRKELERVKDELLALASHEIRNPLASILAALSIVEEDAAQRLSGDDRRHLEIALRESRRLHRIVNGYLDLEKIESGGVEFKLAATPVASIVTKAVEAGRVQEAARGLRFDVVDGLPGAESMADPDRLHQALSNLLSNAAKFTPAGGAITVSISAVGGWVRIAVADQGPGISEQFRSRIFRRFSQDRSAPAAVRDRGAGLGLSIVKAIVERMKGRVGFESRPGQGSTFFIELPKQPSPAR